MAPASWKVERPNRARAARRGELTSGTRRSRKSFARLGRETILRDGSRLPQETSAVPRFPSVQQEVRRAATSERRLRLLGKSSGRTGPSRTTRRVDFRDMEVP